MDFGLSDDQELLQSSAREFLERECPPTLVRHVYDSAEGRSEALDRRIAEMGWNGVLVPDSLGGLGLGVLDAVVLLTELGRAAAPGPFFFSSVLAVAALEAAANARLKKAWLPKLATGETTATVAWLEESDRLDADGIAARATKRGAAWRLSGTKLFVPYAAAADVLVTPFRTSGAGAKGVTLFLVRRDAPGLSIEPLQTIDRTRRVYEVAFRNVEADAVVGKVGEAWPVLERLLDLAAVGLAADSLGGAERALEMAVAYSKTREQFGRPIGSFQAVKHMAAEMVADVEPSRSLVWYAAYAADRRKGASRAASMAKARLSEVYSRTANRAVQMHGGIGFTWEHDVHFWFKRAKWNELAFGDPVFHRERVAELGGY
jgi:alkylation response protein AidB-like acyl-CoA dehydrogenase